MAELDYIFLGKLPKYHTRITRIRSDRADISAGNRHLTGPIVNRLIVNIYFGYMH